MKPHTGSEGDSTCPGAAGALWGRRDSFTQDIPALQVGLPSQLSPMLPRVEAVTCILAPWAKDRWHGRPLGVGVWATSRCSYLEVSSSNVATHAQSHGTLGRDVGKRQSGGSAGTDRVSSQVEAGLECPCFTPLFPMASNPAALS